ncbi:MarR family winged helix-turn-helix transcriptional regulator [Paucibacter sp. R3-3]|uniref:MarR family winged helix-turn-helix transcriptional regulator n=1 Tax=Roseateles agri TaxID=3098619 RepID=A0ABU5DN25_9BURK|nr:MarR family winged helix-turn-helix transcriptional regulator [Paucibacter sp. R3-3]MDY0747730.1 MarR family winged helix-turn-helix transcriptional regulator [Paucibacter sp. R3-3]
MDDFIHSQGLIWLPHILRRLADHFVQACDAVFPEYGIVVPPRAVSTVHLLHEGGPRAVTDIAATIGQSHPQIIKWIKRLKELKLVQTRLDPADRRRTLVSLTPAGRRQAKLLLEARSSFIAAYEKLLGEANAQVFEQLWRVEGALKESAFADRIMVERTKERGGQ